MVPPPRRQRRRRLHARKRARHDDDIDGHGDGAPRRPRSCGAPRTRARPRSELCPPREREAPPSPRSGPNVRFAPEPDRPSPQSQSLSRSYGSDLPTSLTYIVPSTRGCSPWRPAADMGTVGREIHTVSPGCSRAGVSAPDTAGSAVRFGNPPPISGRTDSREREKSLTQKRELYPGPPPTYTWFVCVAARARSVCAPISASRFRNVNLIPFRWVAGRASRLFSERAARTRHDDEGRGTYKHCPCVRQELSHLLGPTDSCSTAVHMKPFSTSAFKVLV